MSHPDPPADQPTPKKPKPPTRRPTAERAYREWSKSFKQHPPHEVCALMAVFFPGKLYCGAASCPPQCPKVGGHPYPEGPPRRASAPPADGVHDAGAPSSAEPPEYAREHEPETDEPETTSMPSVPDVTETTPENIRARELAEDALWAEAADRWVGEPAPAPPPPPPPIPAAAEPEPPRNGLPPCWACGKHRPIMLTMRPMRAGEKGWRLCARCYMGHGSLIGL